MILFVAALAKPKQNSCRGQRISSPTITCRHVEIDGRSITVMSNNAACSIPVPHEDSVVPAVLGTSIEQDTDGDNTGTQGSKDSPPRSQSKTVSQTLGDEDSFNTQGVRQNAKLKMGNAQRESSTTGEDRARRPIHMDKMTTKKERVTYARCLVEVDMAKELTHTVMLHLPDGEEHEQRIYYESLPRYCPQCKVLGHTKESCKGKSATVSKAALPYRAPLRPQRLLPLPQAPGSSLDLPSEKVTSITIPRIDLPPSPESIPKALEIDTSPPIPCLELPCPSLKKVPLTIPRHVGGKIYIQLAGQIANGETKSRGLNKPLKQNGILNHLRKSRAAIMGILETKLSSSILERLVRSNLRGRPCPSRFCRGYKPGYTLRGNLEKDPLGQPAQVRLLFACPMDLSWRFNNLLNVDERVNGRPVTTYETRDFKDCCYDLGLSDIRFSEAERSFCSQLAKGKFLRDCDKGTKFFHNLIKSRRAKSSISSISLADGSRTTSSKQAFDSVVWEFIQDMLHAMSFLLAFIEWIMACITSTSYSIAFNGSFHGFFRGKRGLRQGINDRDLETIKGITGFTQGSSPFRYLGILVAATRFSIGQYSPLIDKISDTINVWAGAFLSYVGRAELIKAVLQGVECFWLAILPIPAGVKAKLAQLCRNFLWSGKCNMTKKPLMSWKEDIQVKKDTFWVQWVHQIHMKRNNFWDYQTKQNDSPLLKQIFALREEIIHAESSIQNAANRLVQWASNGVFQSRIAYEYYKPRSAKITWPKFVWNSSIPPRQSFILWLGLKGRFLTKDKLQTYIDDPLYPFCRSENETIEHLFFHCRIGSQIWAKIKSWLGITRSMQTFKATVKWMIKEARGTGFPAKLKRISLAFTVYHIWGARNKRIFEGKSEHPDSIIKGIQVHVYRSMYN
ncbi:hypothetical protein Acr_07g0011860 [Actinidia rufa]|uniref:Reverse transcriptase zinc-binding domain-containing protein n=1 Tax=Actinidia rufa TaxID=165716 RepID=A0A7J0EX72_9ERIC|nr:hypothetical protein Acr_07g0011860 [Actinidia rufa]